MIQITSFIRSFNISFPPVEGTDISGYVIHACPASELVGGDLIPTNDNLINKGPETSFFFALPENKPAGMWYIKIAAYDTFGLDELTYSDLYSINVASLDPLDQVPPATPTWVSVTSKIEASGQVDNVSITAEWSLTPVPPDFGNYILAYKLSSDQDYLEVFTTEKVHTITNLIAGSSYDFKVKAVDQWNNASDWSTVNSIVAAADTIPPAAVTGLTVTAGMKKVIINFNPVADKDLAGYEVHVSPISGFTPTASTLIASGLDTLYSYDGEVDTNYYVKVRAYDHSGNFSAYSAQASAKTMFVVTQDLVDGIINTAKLAYNAVTSDIIAAKAITTSKIGDDAVTTAQLANDSVTSDIIAANAVTTTEIVDNAISSPKILAGAIIAGKIAANAVTADTVASNAITSGKIAAGAVTAGTIAANAVTAVTISAGAVTAGKIAAEAVVADNIVSNAITAGKIAAGAVTAGTIAANAVTASTIQSGAITSDKITTGELITLSAQIKNAIITDAKIDTITASKITTGTLSASTSISVGDSKIKLDGLNSRITVANNAGTITDMVSIGKLNTGNYGISVKDKDGLQVFKVDEDGAVIQNLTAGTIDADKVTLQNLVVGNNVTMGPNAYISWGNVTSKPTIPTNTNQLTDGAGLGTTAVWDNVSNPSGTKPANNANNTYIDSTGKIQGVSSGSNTVVSNPTAYSQTTAPSSPKLGDTWFNTSTTDGTYQALTGYTYNGSSWVKTTPRGTYIDANGIYTGTLTANNYYLGDGANYGRIETHNYLGKATGIQILDGATPQINVKGGTINGSTINGSTITGGVIQTSETGTNRIYIDGTTDRISYLTADNFSVGSIGLVPISVGYNPGNGFISFSEKDTNNAQTNATSNYTSPFSSTQMRGYGATFHHRGYPGDVVLIENGYLYSPAQALRVEGALLSDFAVGGTVIRPDFTGLYITTYPTTPNGHSGNYTGAYTGISVDMYNTMLATTGYMVGIRGVAKHISSSHYESITGGSVGVLGVGSTYDFYAGSLGAGGYGSFTGAHDALCHSGIEVGDIVYDDSVVVKGGMSSCVSIVKPTSCVKHKAVLGVMLQFVAELGRSYPSGFLGNEIILYELDNMDLHYCVVNSLGEGQINVCKDGGNIEAGDYICSSSRPGKGMKQDDDVLHNYTVAKAREDCVWQEGEDDIRMIACTYHCG